jgi:hypothetical protein
MCVLAYLVRSALIDKSLFNSGFKFSQMEMKAVIATVIENFKLEPAACEKDIYWEMVAIASPIVEGSGEKKHQLPIKLSLISKN